MGGGSALLINSNRRGGAGNDFGCDGWFCDVLNGAMSILVVMIIATALFGCFRKCCCSSKKPKNSPQSSPKPSAQRRISTSSPDLLQNSDDVVPEYHPTSSENPPEYYLNNSEAHIPPAYCSLSFGDDAQKV